MSKLAMLRFTFVVILLVSGAAYAQQFAPRPDLAAQTDRAIAEEMAKQQIPAVLATISVKDEVIYTKAFGLADLENDVKATPATLIRTASVAKPLTAAAAMTLVEAGKLNLDADVQKYCTAFPKKPWPVTTRELLTHTSGIRHYKDDSEIGSTKFFKNSTGGFAIFADDPLLFEPGSSFSYSTYGYSVVGCAIEGASGKPYYEYLHDHVLVPAGMSHTFVDTASAIVPHRARGYTKEGTKVANAGLMDSSYKVPGGGLVTNSEDLVRFANAMMNGKIVSPATLGKMWTETPLPEGSPSKYGMGFRISMSEGEKIVSHGGGQQGTTTELLIIPGKRFALALMANMDEIEMPGLLSRILEIQGMSHPKSEALSPTTVDKKRSGPKRRKLKRLSAKGSSPS